MDLYTDFLIKGDKCSIMEIYGFLLLNKQFREKTSVALKNKGKEMKDVDYSMPITLFVESILISGNKNIIYSEI